MRVNHVGEVCAQAMYDAQALAASSPALRETFVRAAQEEADHLAWTQQRIGELGGRTSLLNPLWYSGAFAIGLAAARLGDRVSLGFMAETERQVEQHLQSHLDRLPEADIESRAIVEQMRQDEAQHAEGGGARRRRHIAVTRALGDATGRATDDQDRALHLGSSAKLLRGPILRLRCSTYRLVRLRSSTQSRPTRYAFQSFLGIFDDPHRMRNLGRLGEHCGR